MQAMLRGSVEDYRGVLHEEGDDVESQTYTKPAKQPCSWCCKPVKHYRIKARGKTYNKGDGAYRCMLYFCSESCKREYFAIRKSLIALIKALRNYAAGGART